LPVSKLELFDETVASSDFNVAVENDTPRVQFLAVVHHDRVRLAHRRKDHRAAQRVTHRHRQVAERLQPPRPSARYNGTSVIHRDHQHATTGPPSSITTVSMLQLDLRHP